MSKEGGALKRSVGRRSLVGILVILIASLCLLIIQVGCGSSRPQSAKAINKSQFEAMRKAQEKVDSFIDEAQKALLVKDVSDKVVRLQHVIQKYQGVLPKSEPSPTPGTQPPALKKSLESTLTGELARATFSGASRKYLAAVDTIYSLYKVEQSVAPHIIGDGSVPNPADPPGLLQPTGGEMTYSSAWVGGDLFAFGISQDPDNGNHVYNYFTSVWSKPSQGTLPVAEQLIIDEGAHLLVQEFKP